MDPTSFTKTSFCGVEIDNITENNAKQFILDQMGLLCSGVQYKSRYAKVYNDQYSRNLKNPHIVCLKSSGAPYLLFLSQINQTNYAFLIDKKIKEGYSYPKIFSLPYQFEKAYYKGSLCECELLRDKNQKWSLLIGDIYYYQGKSQKNRIVMERINLLHDMLENDLEETSFLNTCPIFIKKYFDYHQTSDILENYIPSLSYDIRGFYFVPLRCSYSKILYLFSKDSKYIIANKSQSAKQDKTYQTHQTKVNPMDQTKVNQKNASEAQTIDNPTFRILRTLKPDVYELYGNDGEDLQKVGVALVQSSESSHRILQWLRENENLKVGCRYHSRFQKWEPIAQSDKELSQINLYINNKNE